MFDFIFHTKIGWCLIALIIIFILVYFELPKWLFIMPFLWLFYVFISGTIGTFNNFWERYKERKNGKNI
jgi:hypothetical protein